MPNQVSHDVCGEDAQCIIDSTTGLVQANSVTIWGSARRSPERLRRVRGSPKPRA
jgi:hypothetical protein